MVTTLEDRILGCLEQVAHGLFDGFLGPGFGDGHNCDARFQAWWERYPGH
jgi:hypothetical protein